LDAERRDEAAATCVDGIGLRERVCDEGYVGDFFGREFDVVVHAGGEIEADAALDLGVVVALHSETVAEGDALFCLR
jgi:hypothetical protein